MQGKLSVHRFLTTGPARKEMLIIGPTDKNKVYLAWLKNELYRVKTILSQDDIKIIEHADLGNPEENKRREDILLYSYKRAAILDYLPNNIIWFETQIEKDDIEKLYILPVWNWFLDTGKTFRLTMTKGNLSKIRGHRVSNLPKMAITHKEKIEWISASTSDNPPDITMITSNQEDGPFTIIEGTHRAVSLLIKEKLEGASGFLGVSRDIVNCFWSIENQDIKNRIHDLNQKVNEGIIW